MIPTGKAVLNDRDFVEYAVKNAPDSLPESLNFETHKNITGNN
jgi:hypothetical protein